MVTDVRVLGTLEMGPSSAPRTVSAGKQRALLAALALHAGSAVGAFLLAEVVWGERPPASAAKLLHVYVSQLRKRLPANVSISTHPNGYCLDVAPARVDALLFRQLVDAGHRARDSGELGRATELLGQALDLWRGEAFADVPSALLFDAESERLGAVRLDALESLFALRLEQGEAAQVASDLEVLAKAHPLREGLHTSLALSLYRSGRQDEAFAVYDALRARLLDKLAVDPSPALRDLHLRMLRQDPALDVVSASVPESLPVPLTRTFGRQAELSSLQQLLSDPAHRVVTLTGVGGSGKTRLSLLAADMVRDHFPGGVAHVALVSVRDPALALATITAALGVRDTGGDPVSMMAAQLTRRRLLVVLDNVEQVVAVGPALSRMLGRVPGLTLLVTSRVLLGVEGEQSFPVPPLALPAPGGPLSVEDVSGSPAVALFCERARAALPSFVLDEGNAGAVAELSRRLDGLPLALELAAAQSRTMSPEELLARWTTRLDAPAASQQDRPLRHRSLRSALGGSFELLSAQGRELFAAVSVFAGKLDLPAATAVCATTPTALGELVDHSLLQVVAGASRRFFMLDTVREFAAEQRGDDEALRARHAAYYLAFAEEAGSETAGRPRPRAWCSSTVSRTTCVRCSRRSSTPATSTPSCGWRWRSPATGTCEDSSARADLG